MAVTQEVQPGEQMESAGDYRVVALPVMTKHELAVYAALSTVAVVALVLFARYWMSLPDWSSVPGQYLLATFIVAYHVVAWLLRWVALPRMRRPPPPPPVAPGTRTAAVTTFVPGAESLEMLETTVTAMLAMHGEHDTWVLDEGDDPSVRALCHRLGAHHFTRTNHPELLADAGRYARSTKHGNYNAWLSRIGYARYDVLVSFDPDHVPEPQYLERTLGYFRDPAIAYVQAPQVYYNQRASWIARGAAEETYDYYSAHQMANYGLGHPIVVGSHTAHRISALRAVDGFAVHDADDLLITLLYRSTGWRGVYVPEVLAAGLTPTSWSGYMRQQARWTRSVLDIKIRALRGLVSQLPWVERLLGLFHGIHFLRPLTIPLGYLLLAWLIGTRGLPGFVSPRSLAVLGGLTLLLTAIATFRQRFYLHPARERGLHWRAIVLQFAKWPAQVHAIWQLVRNRRVAYAVTFKIISTSGHQLVLWPHLAFAILLAAAWMLGAVYEPPVAPVRTTLSAIVVAGSLLLTWTEAWRYPPAFDPALYDRYRERRTRDRRIA